MPTASGERVILLTGARGQVGWELRRSLAPLGSLVTPSREELDLRDPGRISTFVRERRPDLIVNAAACAKAEDAELDPELAMAVNGHAPGTLSEEAKRLDIPLVHYSTDYVFDGLPPLGGEQRPYRESDATNPLNVLGETKRAGELAVEAVGAAHLTLRVTWVYGSRGRNFLLAIKRQVDADKDLRVVDDQVGAPTWVRLIAEATAMALMQTWAQGGAAAVAERKGLYHLTAQGETTWHHFAEQIVATLFGTHDAPSVMPIPSSAFPTNIKRPAYSVLDSKNFTDNFNIALPDWEEELLLCLQELKWVR